MFKRIIKDNKSFRSKDIETLDIGNRKIHPITTNLVDTRNFNNPICLTKMYIKNDKLNIYNNYICNGENKYKDYITLPPIYFDSNDLLQIYNIIDIESLNIWVKSNIDLYNIVTISRVLNCWIENNIDIIKINNNLINNIYINIISMYINPKIQEKISDEKEVKDYIKYWIDKYDKNDNNNLYNDLIKYINLKYNKYI